MRLQGQGAGRFDVWAPKVESVTLLARDRDYVMTRRPHEAPGDEGWWTAANAPAEGEVEYGYRLGGDADAVPDPRSRRQPNGVHSLSRTFDPSEYVWGDEAWTGRELTGAVIYELHVGTFTPEGTLDAAAGKLDYLAELGIDFIELLPVNGFNGTHNWGYDGVLWYAVHEGYGG
ncbi:MAG: malto-oligosyltrehalose trehalohydrolase, partial [Arthrobacter sp.]|nr:malto-oligosyltrehalose trehalohydrolase [Arthrobacter sp.]